MNVRDRQIPIYVRKVMAFSERIEYSPVDWKERDFKRSIDSTMAHNDGLKELEVEKVFTIIDNYPH